MSIEDDLYGLLLAIKAESGDRLETEDIPPLRCCRDTEAGLCLVCWVMEENGYRLRSPEDCPRRHPIREVSCPRWRTGDGPDQG